MGTGHGRELTRVLYYALGGGLGHLMRGVAFARHAQRRGGRVAILTNSPFAVAVHEPGVELVRLLPTAAPREVVAAIAKRRFDTLVVDTFPRGIGGELVELLDAFAGPKYLVHRDLDPRYVAAKSLRGWVDRYDALFVPGEDAPFAEHPRAVRTAPWFVRDSDELLDRAAARARLGVSDERRLVGVVASGRLEEGAHFAFVADALRARIDADVLLLTPMARPDLRDARATWPLFELVYAFDVLVGAGGYNTVQEARATKTPLVGWAMPRRYDRQALRLGADAVQDLGSAVSAVRAYLAQGRARDLRFDNGARTAAEAVLERTDRSDGGAIRTRGRPGSSRAGRPRGAR